MADLRLLTVALVLVFACSGTVCDSSLHEIEVPRIAGRVTDKRTGEPVEGAAILIQVVVQNMRAGPIDTGVGEIGGRWVTTDAEGRFEFPLLTLKVRGYMMVDEFPAPFLLHRDYGHPMVYMPSDHAAWTDIHWAIEPDPRTLEYFKNPKYYGDLCGILNGEPYFYCCEFAYGKVRECEQGRIPKQ